MQSKRGSDTITTYPIRFTTLDHQFYALEKRRAAARSSYNVDQARAVDAQMSVLAQERQRRREESSEKAHTQWVQTQQARKRALQSRLDELGVTLGEELKV